MRFEGRSVVLTGGSGAMGARIASHIVRSGGHVTVVDLRAGTVAGVEYLQGDLASPADLERLAGVLADRDVDILINLAGIQHFGPLDQESPGHLAATYMINLAAPARLIQTVLPGMKSRSRGQVVNVGSIFGSIAFAHFATYSSSKAGLRALSEALRRELDGSGVSVTYIAPRAVRTPLNSAAVNAFAAATGMVMDEPEAIAARISAAIESDRRDVYLGFPESLFVRVNGLAPRLVDRALRANDRKARALFPA